MKKQTKITEKEMTIMEVGVLVLGLMEKTDKLAEKNGNLESLVEQLAISTHDGFERQGRQIQELRQDLNEFKEETNENFGKVRRDIFNLDDRFVSHSEFQKFKLKTG